MSSPDSVSSFADSVAGFSRLVHGLTALPPAVRAEALAAHVAHLYALGLRLPEAAAAETAPEAGAWPTDWPGLGAADRSHPPATVLLRGLWSDLDRGARAAAADQGGWWRSTFTTRWGALAVAALERLQAEIMEVRTGAPVQRAEVAPPPAPPLLPSFEPAPPERRSTGRSRARSSAAPRAVLGVRFAADPSGLRVEAVHPAGPAAGLLAPGDVVLRVDGVPLAGRDDDAVAAALEGAPGQVRRLSVEGAEGAREVAIAGVAPQDLASAPVELTLLVLDRDAAGGLLASLERIGFQVSASNDQEGLVGVRGPAGAAAALRLALREGAEHGWWEVLEGP